MEEILCKDTFDDLALRKLSPDYSPSDIILRLQARRSFVKDTHCHRIKRHLNSNSRRHLKTPSDNFEKTLINKELTKLKSSFQKKNVTNSMELQKCNKNIKNNLSKKDIFHNDLNLLDHDIHETENNVISFLEKHVSDFNETIDKTTEIDALQINGIVCSGTVDTQTFASSFDKKNYETPFIQTEQITSPQDNLVRKSVDEIKYSYNDLQSLFIKMAITSCSNNESHDSDHVQDLYKKRVKDFDENVTGVGTLALENMDFLRIEMIKEKLGEREKYLLQKYAKKWKEYVRNKESSLAAKRQSVLNNFFNKLEKRKNSQNELSASANKAALLARDYKTYHHRYKVQKHIIALQKAKLEEQNRTIDELKYNKIVEASKLSVDAMKEEVRKTYYEMDRQLKPKIKCLTNELKLHEIEEPALVLHCLKVPQFLQRMEKRAREREEKHAIIRERRQQMEEERIKLKQQAELAKAEMDKEEKIVRMKELKDKRNREKMESIRKKQHAEKMRALIVMADLHYEKNLKYRLGLQPLMQLLKLKRFSTEKAKRHYKFQLVKNVFLHWMWYAEDQCYERNYIAERFYKNKILGRIFETLKVNRNELVLKKQVAEDYYDLYVVQLIFRKFRVGIAASRLENSLKMEKAIAYHNSNLKFKIFACWSTLPALNALQREQEARKSRWREKVLQVVPDYAPPDD